MTHILRRSTLSGADQLWNTLPRRLRMRDDPEAGGDGLLRGLVDVFGRGLDAVRDDIFRLYDDLFVETCDPRLIPLIGDLVGVDVDPDVPVERQRYQVKSAVHWARRRGTAAQIEALAWIVSGFRARVREPGGFGDEVQGPPHAATVSGADVVPGASALRLADWQPERRITVELAVAWPVRRTTRLLVPVGPNLYAWDAARDVGLRRGDGTPIFRTDDPRALAGPGRALDLALTGADAERHGRLHTRFMRLARGLVPRVPARTLALDPERGLASGPAAPLPGILGERRLVLHGFEPLRGVWSEHPPLQLGDGVFSFSPAGDDRPLCDEQGHRLVLVREGEPPPPALAPDERIVFVGHPAAARPCDLARPFELLPPGRLPDVHLVGERLDRAGLSVLFTVVDEWSWEVFSEVRLVHDFRGDPPADHVVEVDVRRGRFRVNPARAAAVRRVGSFHRFDVEAVRHRLVQVLRSAMPLGRTCRLVFRDTAPGHREVIP